MPPRRLAARAVRLASSAAWRALHPALREPYLEARRPRPLRRCYYRSDDGWHCPLFHVPPAPGGAGEPVVLVHSLGAGHDAFRYGHASLARALSAAGFSVYLMAHRGDRDAVAPSRAAAREATFSATLDHDLQAALAAAADDSGFSRCHLIGHGLGGVLALAWAGRRGSHLATVTTLAAPLLLHDPPSEARRTAWLLGLAPRGLHLPLRAMLRAGVPLLDEGAGLAMHLAPGVSPAPRVRGALTYAGADVPLALVRELRGWLAAGTPLIHGVIEVQETLRDAEVPLLCVVGDEDQLCPPESGGVAVERWGHPDPTLLTVPGHGHLDLLWGANATDQVFPGIVDWIAAHRRQAWDEEPLAHAG